MSDKADHTPYIVIRPATPIDDSDLASVYEGEWRQRHDLERADYVELDGPEGRVRAYPTQRIETSPAGDTAQVYEVPDNHDEGSEPLRG